MATRRMLLNSYQQTGRDMKSFSRGVKAMADATEVLTVKASEVTVLSLCRIAKYQKDGQTVFYILSEEYVDDFLDFGEKLHLGAFNNAELGDELLEELKDGTGMLIVVDKEKYIISRSALTTLSQRACVSGDTTVNRNNLARDLHLADALFSRNEWINFVYRHVDGVNKVFAAFSSDFVLNRQDVLIRALEHTDFPFKEMAVRSYSIDNSITEIYFDLPAEHPDIIPGLAIRNSDTGDSSLIIRVTCRIGGSYAIISESLLRHDRYFTFDKLMYDTIASAKESFNNLSPSFGDDLQALKEHSVIDYSAFNSMSNKCRENNFSAVEELLTDGIYYLYRQNLSKKAFKNACRFLVDEIDAGKEYSCFDVAAMLISVPEHLSELDNATLTNLRKNASKIPAFFSKKS